ncbi:MAG: chorismate-binding protein, partial [Acidimicrobiales bacterium]
ARTFTVLSGFVEEWRAERLDEVRPLLVRVADAARRGHFVAGYLAYECAPAFDDALVVSSAPSEPARLPLAWFGVFAAREVVPLSLPDGPSNDDVDWNVATSRDDHALAVKSILDDIAQGNAYQVNLTSPVVARDVDARGLYRRLVTAQQPAHAALLEFDGLAIASASPELFVEWDGSLVRSRQMKGTAPRGRWPGEDDERVARLVASTKDRAENVMIADLVRNDLGRIAEVGTVEVTSLCEVERYPTVFQMVSEVTAVTRPDVELVDVIAATFPCGSVTGAPKASAMGIIAKTEAAPRGVYCGAVGLVSPSPRGVSARFNVAIRTAVVDQREGTVRFASGGGVVADSTPEGEYRELVLKAEVLRGRDSSATRLLDTFRVSVRSRNDHVERHVSRLRRSADRLGYSVPDGLIELVASRCRDRDADARVRLLLSRRGDVDIEVDDAPRDDDAPVVLAIDDEPVDSADPSLFYKTTDRERYDRRRRRHPVADDVVMVNERGECTETTIANLAVRVGSLWMTPPLSAGCLPGIERERRVESGELVEGTITVSDLRGAAEVAVLSSLRGWRRAVVRASETSTANARRE